MDKSRTETKPLRAEEQATRELEAAIRWYEERSPGLGTRFLAAISDTLEQVARLPLAGGSVPGVSVALSVRRAPVKRFPYPVVYLETKDTIWILAFAHDRRRPGYWLSRAKAHQ